MSQSNQTNPFLLRNFWRTLLGVSMVFCRRALDVVCLTGPCCRFTPSCSHYAKEALELHGLFSGGLLATRRLMKCQFWGPSGWDPVPGGRQHGI